MRTKRLLVVAVAVLGLGLPVLASQAPTGCWAVLCAYTPPLGVWCVPVPIPCGVTCPEWLLWCGR